MRLASITTLSIVLGFALGCDRLPGKDEKAASDGEKDGSKTTEVDPKVDPEPPEEDPLAEGFQLGLPDFCSFDAERGCFKCSPREIPIEQCAKGESLPADFDPAADCRHDGKVLECLEFTFDLENKSTLEKIYEKIPTLVTLAKVALASKFSHKPDSLKLINQGLDVLVKHRLALFSGLDMTQAATDISQIAKSVNPDLSQEKMTEIETKIMAALDAISEKRRSGAMTDEDMLLLAMSFVAQLPGVEDLMGSGTDIETILAAIEGKKDPKAVLDAFMSSDDEDDKEEE